MFIIVYIIKNLLINVGIMSIMYGELDDFTKLMRTLWLKFTMANCQYGMFSKISI